MTLVLLVVDVATVSLIAVAIAIVSLLFFGRRPLRAGAAAIIGSLRRVAYFLVGLAVLFAALWSLHVARWVDELAPNVITESLAIALALTVIDQIVQRRDSERVLPLVDYTLDNIDLGVMITVETIAIDYAQSHRVLKRIPERAGDLIDFWLENESLEDAPRRIGNQGPWPYPTGFVFEFAQSTYRQTEENRHDFMTAGLTEIVMASKRFATSIGILQELILADTGARDAPDYSLSAKDRLARREESERLHRRRAVEILATFVAEYEGKRTGRSPLLAPRDMNATVEHFRPVTDDLAPPA
jgi:hypothetical protein